VLHDIDQHYGRNFCDMLLRHVSATLRACCRATDTVARGGSDDFALLLRGPKCGTEVVKVIKRIHAMLDVPFAVWGQRLDSVQAHFGVIFPLCDYENAEHVLRDARLAARRARASDNRLGCKFFSKEMIAKARQNFSLKAVLQKERDLKGFHIVYQPIVRSENHTLHAFEALLRWTNGGRAVSPDAFIPIAEETGFIINLGNFAIEAACHQLRQWHKHDCSINMHVNISPHQLVANDFPGSVEEILHHTGVDASSLFFEVTESVFLHGFPKVLRNINKLRQFGVRFCLDDFGIGYSSLSYLRQLPIDCLKIDRSFVSDLERNAVSRIMLKHISALSKDIGCCLVVEGVERYTQLHLLGASEDMLLQGFYFYKPLPADEANGLLTEHCVKG
jgi:Amt family ammonium transporter